MNLSTMLASHSSRMFYNNIFMFLCFYVNKKRLYEHSASALWAMSLHQGKVKLEAEESEFTLEWVVYNLQRGCENIEHKRNLKSKSKTLKMIVLLCLSSR